MEGERCFNPLKKGVTFMAIQPTPPGHVPPPEIAGLIFRAYENPLVSLNKAENETLISGGGTLGGGWLNSHE